MIDSLRPVFASFESHDVRYVVIGGVAAALHGVPRATFDVDILIEATKSNAERLLRALLAAGWGTASLTTADDVLRHDITQFRDRIPIDVMTTAPGIDFHQAWQRRLTLVRAGQAFHVVSRDDLILSKLASGRPKDQEDVRALRQNAGESPRAS